ncbi:MAG: MarR family transcriptional regulator [Actinobacteria bacterium]|nr:MarR family transcriptional regulator [Actinomycetota bacterium]
MARAQTAHESTDDLNELLESLGRLLTSRQVFTGLAELARVDVSQQGMQIMRALNRNGKQPVATLARHAMMDIAAVSRQLRLLEAQGLVKRQTDASDGRVAVISLTAAGSRAVKRMLAVQHRQLDKSLAGWSPAQRRQLVANLDRLCADLRTVGQQPAKAG